MRGMAPGACRLESSWANCSDPPGPKEFPQMVAYITEIPPKDVIDSALGLTVIWPELQVPGF